METERIALSQRERDLWVANSASALNLELLRSDTIFSMRDIFTLLLHAIVIIVRLGRPGGLRSVVAESVLLRHQVLILNRGRKRAPNLRTPDRIIAGLSTLLMRPARVAGELLFRQPSPTENAIRRECRCNQ
jgi:hypothetical protein